MSWIKTRFNRDNFWNLMFWFGTIICIGLIEFLVKSFELGIFAFIFMIFSIVYVPYILAKCNDVEYANKVFFNKQGMNITDNLREDLSFTISSTILLTAFLYIPFIMLNGYIVFGLVITNFLGFILLVLIICFIYRNCPVSILFNKEFWKIKTSNISSRHFICRNTSSSILSKNSSSCLSPNYITDPKYSGLSFNIHNSNYHKK